MYHTLTAAALLTTLAAANPQWGGPHGSQNGGNWGQGGPWAAFPSCVESCRDQNTDYSNKADLCSKTDTLSTLSSCVDSSSCSDSEKSDVKQAIAQLCVNAGASITAAPFNTYAVTSGKWNTAPTAPAAWGNAGPWAQWASDNSVTGWPTNTAEWSSWATANGLPTATSEWSAWASSKGWGPGPAHFGGGGGGGSWPASAWSDFSSWTSVAGLTAAPTDTAQWDSITAAHPLPSDLSSAASWWRANGFPGGSAWPTAWTTNSAWASAVSAWGGPNGTRGPGGWHGGAFGPFGQGGPGRDGWGNGPWTSGGAWTSGAWTSWWGTDACPTSTWSGWTDASWSNSAPWTSWSACTASTTATSIVTVTTTDSYGNQITSLSTSFGIRVAEATLATTTDSNGNVVTSTRDSAAMPTAMLGSAAGVLGVVAGALLL